MLEQFILEVIQRFGKWSGNQLQSIVTHEYFNIPDIKTHLEASHDCKMAFSTRFKGSHFVNGARNQKCNRL